MGASWQRHDNKEATMSIRNLQIISVMHTKCDTIHTVRGMGSFGGTTQSELQITNGKAMELRTWTTRGEGLNSLGYCFLDCTKSLTDFIAKVYIISYRFLRNLSFESHSKEINI